VAAAAVSVRPSRARQGFFGAGAVFAGGLAVFGAGLVPCANASDEEDERECSDQNGKTKVSIHQSSRGKGSITLHPIGLPR
jgi:hypothetical protein